MKTSSTAFSKIHQGVMGKPSKCPKCKMDNVFSLANLLARCLQKNSTVSLCDMRIQLMRCHIKGHFKKQLLGLQYTYT